MQRRNHLQPVKGRPKLVINRPPAPNVRLDTVNMDKTVTALKISKFNKQNDEIPQAPSKQHSLDPTKRKRLARSKSSYTSIPDFNNQGKFNKRADSFDFPHLQIKQIITSEEVINKVLKIMRPINKNAEYEAFAQKVEMRLKKVLNIMLQSVSNNRQLLRVIDQKMSVLVQLPLIQFKQLNYLPSVINKRPAVMALHRYIDEAFTLNNNASLGKERMSKFSFNSEIFTFSLSNEMVKERNSFIFKHLEEVNDYVMNQPNKILHHAVRRHKYLEEEMFAYADFISISRLGSNVYTPQANIQHIESQLDRLMRSLNRQLMQGKQEQSQKQENEGFRATGPAGIFHHSNYSITQLEQFISVINKKTEQAKTFMSKVLSWEENYLTRKQYLGNLKKQYCQCLFRITKSLNGLKSISKQDMVRDSVSVIEEAVAKIDNIYLLGNSFY